MNRFREMKYDYLGEAIWVNEENYNQQTSVARFFYDYFQTVINGRYDEYEDYFSEDFFHKHSIPEKFTKQKIYDIEVSFLDSEAVGDVVYETYKVGYKIYMNISKIIGNNIKSARKFKNLTQQQVANLMHMTQQQYSRFENGVFQLNYEQIIFICNLLEISFDEFFDIKNYNNENT